MVGILWWILDLFLLDIEEVCQGRDADRALAVDLSAGGLALLSSDLGGQLELAVSVGLDGVKVLEKAPNGSLLTVQLKLRLGESFTDQELGTSSGVLGLNPLKHISEVNNELLLDITSLPVGICTCGQNQGLLGDCQAGQSGHCHGGLNGAGSQTQFKTQKTIS